MADHFDDLTTNGIRDNIAPERPVIDGAEVEVEPNAELVAVLLNC